MIARLRVIPIRYFSVPSALERFTISIPKAKGIIYTGNQKQSDNSFKSLGFSTQMVDLLMQKKIETPTPIQLLSIPAIFKHHKVVVGGETGSGKTLSFLYPVMQEIKAYEQRTPDIDSTKPAHPKGIVLVPTNELALQVKSEAKFLAKVIKLRVQALFHNMPVKYYKNVLASPIELLILTPQKLVKLVQQQHIYLAHLSHLVIDEGDSLLDTRANFGEDTLEIIRFISKEEPKIDPKLIISCATMTDAFHSSIRTLEKLIPSEHFRYVISPGLHKPPRGIRQSFVNVMGGREEKRKRLLTIIKASNKERRILVFCNKIATMESIRSYLKMNGIMHYSWEKEESKLRKQPLTCKPNEMYDCIHGYLTVLKRKEIIDEFNEHKFTILLASGLTGRGMDFGGGVELVVLYDMPKNPVDYLHRIGRSARAFSPGKSIAFVTGVARKIVTEIQHFGSRNRRICGSLRTTICRRKKSFKKISFKSSNSN